MRLRFVVVLAAAAAALSFSTVVPRAAPAVISFTHEITLDPQRADGEPDLALAANGTEMYASTPWGFSTTVSFAWKSLDSGVQWYNLHGSSACAPGAELRPDCSRGGGDTEIQLSSPQGTSTHETVQFVDLNGLDTLSCAYSTDGGDTFVDLPGGNLAGQVCNIGLPPGTIPGSDRQWIAVCRVGDPCDGAATADKLYMVFDTGDTPPSGDNAIASTDGGHTWSVQCASTTSGSCVGGAGSVGSRPGPVYLNRATGTLYEFMGLSANGAEVNISCNGGVSWGHKTIATGEFGATTNDFVAGGIDSQGNLYATWAQDNGSFNSTADPTKPWYTMYSYSTDTVVPAFTSGAGPGGCVAPVKGGSWSTPVAINGPQLSYSGAPSVTTTNATGVNFAVMPWLTVGDPGRVDVVYYGSTNALPLDISSAPATFYLHMSQTLNGQTATPSFNDVQASETPMHNNSICFLGISCTGTGDRNLLDFFEVKTDASGRADIIYTDDNNSATSATFPGAGIIAMVQQASGPGLYTATPSVPPPMSSQLSQSLDVRNEVTDPSGDGTLQGGAGSLHNLPQPGSENGALDITDLKVINKDANTLEFLFTLNGLSAGHATAVSGANHAGAIWLATWYRNNDLWFASANTDATGLTTCLAGRPTSTFTSGGPKSLQYIPSTQASNVTGCTFDDPHNTIEIDVPRSDVGSPADGSILYGLTGFSGDTLATADISTVDGISIAFFDNADQTAPIDAAVGASVVTPEVPSVTLLAILGAATLSAAGYLRRRRRTRATAI